MKKLFTILAMLIIIQNMNAQTIVEGNNLFAFDLLKQLKDQNVNVFFSPYSISTALFMTAGGARNKTEKQMLEVLHQSQNSLEYHKKFGDVIIKAENKKNVELSIANSIWPQKGYHFKIEYLALLKNAYKIQVAECDFAKSPNEEALKINNWVADKTKNKIIDIIKPDMLDATTKMVLANAIYFYGDWKIAFDKEKNVEAEFYKNDGSAAKTNFMNAEYSMKYASDDMFKVISINYKNNEVSLFVFLPNDPDSFSIALNSLDLRRFTLIDKSMREEKINLFLPKFKMTSEFMLEEKLPEMGMVDAFSSEADFSGMTGDKSLMISKVIHKAYIDVSEKGTEAAAATVVIMSRNGGSHKPIVFKADHPFIFIIKDNTTGQLLFIGILNDPKE
jgi:serpin B